LSATILNFRSKLWSSRKAIEVTGKIIPYVDVLIGNEEDFQKVLGFTVEGLMQASRASRGGIQTDGGSGGEEIPGHPCCRDDIARSGQRVGEQLVSHHYYDGTFLRIAQVHEPGNRGPRRGGDGFCSGFVYASFTG